MVALPNTYKPEEVEAATGGGGIPPGKYRCVIVGSSEKANKAGTGTFVEFIYQVTEGPQKGSSIKDRFNFENPNKKAVDIAFAQFKALAQAAGKPDVTDTDALNNAIVVITWDLQDNSSYCEVKKYEPSTASIDGYTPRPVKEKPAATAAPAANTDGKPAWA